MPLNYLLDPDEELSLDSPALPPMTAPTPAPAAATPPADSSAMVNDYISKKYGLGQYSDQNRKQLEDQSQLDTSDRIGAGLAALGAGFTGRDASAAGLSALQARRSQKRQALEDFDKNRASKIQDVQLGQEIAKNETDVDKRKRENDPTSDESKLAQDAAIKMGVKPEIASKITAAQFKEQGPIYEKIYAVNEANKTKREAAVAKQNEGVSEGRKATDKDYAKDFNEWTSTGRNALQKNIDRLQEAKNALQTDPTLTGSWRGSLPDAIRNATNEKAITTRDDVRAAAQGALKATLGSQFTEKEGERIMNQAYNEKLSPQANIEKIDRAIKELMANRDNNDRKAQFFQQKGTLTGLDTAAPARTVVKTQTNPKTGQKRVVYSDGTTEPINSVAKGE